MTDEYDDFTDDNPEASSDAFCRGGSVKTAERVTTTITGPVTVEGVRGWPMPDCAVPLRIELVDWSPVREATA